ncbi:hypothetical protein GCM10011519_26140 [Marmoricola endophyticus]|uniref:Uncharacterized protein n=1 Tax=Marmoricola endophyticus TaxID=2040280 RepID=A0A917F5T4_9ACTN|nr:hypothetical protein [Marmoricola endophyticus]GGF50934.1 hypothetical protein GCM10011519_26140 [Marmoricola endophyticus]
MTDDRDGVPESGAYPDPEGIAADLPPLRTTRIDEAELEAISAAVARGRMVGLRRVLLISVVLLAAVAVVVSRDLLSLGPVVLVALLVFWLGPRTVRSGVRGELGLLLPVGSVVGIGVADDVVRTERDGTERLLHPGFVRSVKTSSATVQLRTREEELLTFPRSLITDADVERLERARERPVGGGLLARSLALPWAGELGVAGTAARRRMVVSRLHRSPAFWALVVVGLAWVGLRLLRDGRQGFYWLAGLLVLLAVLETLVRRRVRRALPTRAGAGPGTSYRIGREADHLVVATAFSVTSWPLDRLAEVTSTHPVLELRWERPSATLLLPADAVPDDEVGRLRARGGRES